LDRLKEAFQYGYSVYSLKFNNGKIKDAKLCSDTDELQADFNKLWGPKITDRSRRLLIALKPLPFASHQKVYKQTEASMKVPQAWQDAGKKDSSRGNTRVMAMADETAFQVPQAYVQAGKKETTKVTARIDMSAEVAGAGKCPECRKGMEISHANDIEVLVCHPCRIAIPTADKPVEENAVFGPSTADGPTGPTGPIGPNA
jgi:hypothetical protein